MPRGKKIRPGVPSWSYHVEVNAACGTPRGRQEKPVVPPRAAPATMYPPLL